MKVGDSSKAAIKEREKRLYEHKLPWGADQRRLGGSTRPAQDSLNLSNRYRPKA